MGLCARARDDELPGRTERQCARSARRAPAEPAPKCASGHRDSSDGIGTELATPDRLARFDAGAAMGACVVANMGTEEWLCADGRWELCVAAARLIFGRVKSRP